MSARRKGNRKQDGNVQKTSQPTPEDMAENRQTGSIPDEVGSDNHSNGHACTKCSTKASFYCQVCDVFYCRGCMKYICDHSVLGRSDVERWGQKIRDQEMEKCARHPRKEVELYCGHHEVLCCTICVSLEHRHCQNMEYIPEACKNYDKNDDLRKIDDGFQTVRNKVDNLYSDRKSRTTTLNNLHHDVISNIRQYRKEINTILDDLERKSLDEVRHIEKYHNGILKKDLVSCQKIEETLAEYQSRLKELDRSDKCHVFVQVKKCCEWLSKTLDVFKEAENVKLHEKMEFGGHEKIRATLTPLKGLGCITNIQYSVTNVKHLKGITTNKFSRMCQLPDGTIAVVDHDMYSMILLDTAYNVSRKLRCSHIMTDICSIGNSEVLTCSTSDYKIRFLSIGTSSVKENISVQTNPFSSALAYSNGFLFGISAGDYAVRKYSSSGTNLETYKLCSFPHDIAASDDGKTIYVADEQGLVIIDDQGKHITTLAGPHKDGHGLDRVCTGPGGTVFVSRKNKLYQLTNYGTSKFVELVGCHPNMYQLYTDILFDRQNSNVLVLANIDRIGRESLYVFECTLF